MVALDTRYRLVTSNMGKWREFTRLGLGCGHVALDLDEVDGTPLEVILNKSRDAGPFTVCEDTSLETEGETVGVNVRWLLDRVGELVGRRAEWRVMLAVNDGVSVSVHEGVVEGAIVVPGPEGGFGFDPVFAPDGFGGLTLSDLERAGRKDEVSARAHAVASLRDGTPTWRVALADIPAWEGGWQAHP